jgi:hypothetical protein
MSRTPAPGSSEARALNRVALIVALLLFAGIATFWWRDRHRARVTPRWDEAGAVALRTASVFNREQWIVAVNPECAHCRDRLAALAGALAKRSDRPALGVLLVDVPHRPDSLAGAGGFAAGVWWDSTATWRGRWGRSAYGEVMVFSPGGSLRRILPPDSSAAPR